MRPLAVLLTILLFAGCAQIVHPATPGQAYSSMEVCPRYAQEQRQDPLQCEKIIDQHGTVRAVGVGVLAAFYVGLLVILGIAASR